VILVGEDAASQVYVRNKVNACAQAGFHSEKISYPPDVEPQVVLAKIAELNADPQIHGILVQLPLPKHFDSDAVLKAISPAKDVDGFHAENVGALMQGHPRFIPCTPVWRHAVLRRRRHRPQRQGGSRPRTLEHRRQADGDAADAGQRDGHHLPFADARPAFHTRRADILVAALGKARFVTADMVKPGAVVIDVGINRLPDGKLCGDVDFAGVSEVASAITPVPGGVGR
jgi:methylenetetrahydrofolate dehydrogenase (NADP+)/methenyltetrahydrofolate cyclohydrolase